MGGRGPRGWLCTVVLLATLALVAAGTAMATLTRAGSVARPKATKSLSDVEAGRVVLEALEDFYNSDGTCGNASATRRYVNRGEGEGLGSLLSGYLITSLHALLRGQRLCSNGSRIAYTNATRCKSQSWDCLFEPVSSQCPCASSSPTTLQAWAPLKPQRCFDDADEQASSNGVRFLVWRRLSKRLRMTLPKRNDHWYIAVLSAYLFRPTPHVLAYKEYLRSLMPGFNPSDAVAVHVRRGDHWMGEHLGDDVYLDAVRAVAHATGASSVLLATDDLALLDSFPARLAPLRVFAVPARLSVLGRHARECAHGRDKACHATRFIRQDTHGSSDEGRLLVAQMLLMADTKATVGTIGSNFARAVHRLQHARDILRGGPSGALRAHPMLSFLEVTGDHYFACGWRKSAHLSRRADVVISEWVQRYRYYSTPPIVASASAGSPTGAAGNPSPASKGT